MANSVLSENLGGVSNFIKKLEYLKLYFEAEKQIEYFPFSLIPGKKKLAIHSYSK